jgi:hypothetical protein
MVSLEIEQYFRQLMEKFPLAHQPARAELENVWRLVREDADVQSVLCRLLFIPHPVPDKVQGERLIQILNHLHGQPTKLQFFEDVIVTDAEIMAVRVQRDSEGPTYFVRYQYGNGHSLEREFGYDAYHAAMCGWGEPELGAYWRVGNRVPCHYRANQPEQHYICQP